MSREAEQRLGEDRAVRRAARGLFDRRLAQVKADLAARGVGGRIKAKAQDQAFKALDQGLAVASESKGIIAGTVAALGLWFARKPLLSSLRRLFAKAPVQDRADSEGGAEFEE